MGGGHREGVVGVDVDDDVRVENAVDSFLIDTGEGWLEGSSDYPRINDSSVNHVRERTLDAFDDPNDALGLIGGLL